MSESAQMNHEVGRASDKGQARDNNEDSAATIDIGLLDGDLQRSIGVQVVADGIGGSMSGEVASKQAVHTTIEEIMKLFSESEDVVPEEAKKWLVDVVRTANEVIYDNPTEMGTTLVASVLVDNQVFIANVGDSRAYLINREGIKQITQDHSFVQGLVDAGAITPEKAKEHPQRNILSQAVGMEDRVKVDTFSAHVESGDYLLLCSDGLTSELEDDQIKDIILQSESPQAACDDLVAAANEAGGHDNISVILVQMKPA